MYIKYEYKYVAKALGRNRYGKLILFKGVGKRDVYHRHHVLCDMLYTQTHTYYGQQPNYRLIKVQPVSVKRT